MFVSPLGRSAAPGGGKSPGRFVLVSAVVQGHRCEFRVGGLWRLTASTSPRLAGDHEMSLQVQPKPENPLNL